MTADAINSHCVTSSIRLCETCCRREHEVENVLGKYTDGHVGVANVEDVRRAYMQRFSSRLSRTLFDSDCLSHDFLDGSGSSLFAVKRSTSLSASTWVKHQGRFDRVSTNLQS